MITYHNCTCGHAVTQHNFHEEFNCRMCPCEDYNPYKPKVKETQMKLFKFTTRETRDNAITTLVAASNIKDATQRFLIEHPLVVTFSVAGGTEIVLLG